MRLDGFLYLRALGSSRGGRLLFRGARHPALVGIVKVYLAQGRELLPRVLEQCLCLVVDGFGGPWFLLFRLLELSGLVFRGLVALILFYERLVLFVGNFEAGLTFHFAKLRFLLQESNCRLESYVQFSYYFVQSDTHVFSL